MSGDKAKRASMEGCVNRGPCSWQWQSAHRCREVESAGILARLWVSPRELRRIQVSSCQDGNVIHHLNAKKPGLSDARYGRKRILLRRFCDLVVGALCCQRSD